MGEGGQFCRLENVSNSDSLFSARSSRLAALPLQEAESKIGLSTVKGISPRRTTRESNVKIHASHRKGQKSVLKEEFFNFNTVINVERVSEMIKFQRNDA